MKKEWFSAEELAKEALPGYPKTDRQWREIARVQRWTTNADLVRKREGRGGGVEYHYSLLPQDARSMLETKYVGRLASGQDNSAASAKAVVSAERSAAAWAYLDHVPFKQKDEAARRLKAIIKLEELTPVIGSGAAFDQVATEFEVTSSTLRNWLKLLRGVPRADWYPALVPDKRGAGGRKVDIHPDVWEYISSDYLRLSEPGINSCYRRAERFARDRGLPMPKHRTVLRRLKELPTAMVVLARKGPDAAAKLYPAQKRDRSMLHAMEAVNADGHRWDVRCHLEDGTEIRPASLVFQDLYSNKILSWRYDLGENKELVRLAFGDMCMSFGVPNICLFDNGPAFASKWITGGIKNRFRFKIKEEEPLGIITQLGTEVKWATPAHGQAKPIERAFRDFADDISRGPWFEGAYTGNSPMAKPANYGTRSIPFEEFKRIVDREIMEHNARTGRQTDACGGKLSFNQAFDASYAKSVIRKPSPEELQICLLTAESVKARSRDGSIYLMENRYWHEKLVNELGNKLVIRFDPDKLHADLPVYRRDGTLICVAKLVEAAGFFDAKAARDHSRARNAFVRATRDVLAAEKKLNAQEIANLLPKGAGIIPEPKPIAARKPVMDNLARNIANEDAAEAEFFENLKASLRVVPGRNSDPLDE